MRRILYYSLLCFLWVSVNSCKDDEASQPPTPTLTNVSGFSAGKLSDTKFTFEVQQVGAGSMSFLPYGTEFPAYGGILIPASSFQAGKATIEFTYAHIGTFQAVAAANNHSGDGNSVKTSYSAPVQIVITSDRAVLSDFSFDGSTKTEVDGNDVKITIPWSKHESINALALRFSKSPESTVKVGSTEVSSDANPQDFSDGATVTYTVTSQDGTVSNDYNVSVIQTPAEEVTSVKSATGIIANKGKVGDGAIKVATGRTLPGYIDNDAQYIVLYDTLNSTITAYDSLSFDFALNGSFAGAKYKGNNGTWHVDGEKLEGKDTLNLKDNPGVTFTVTAEDGTTEDYTVYIGEAPKLYAATTNLNPGVSGSSDPSYALTLTLLDGTDKTDIDTDFTFDLPDGATIADVEVIGGDNDGDSLPNVLGVYKAMSLDYSAGVKLAVTVNHPDVPEPYVVTYTISTPTVK